MLFNYNIPVIKVQVATFSEPEKRKERLFAAWIDRDILSKRKLLIKLSVTNFRVLSQDKPMTFHQQDALQQSYRRPELLGHVV